MKSSDIHIRAISQEMPLSSITKICLNITWLKFRWNFPGANGMNAYCTVTVFKLPCTWRVSHDSLWATDLQWPILFEEVNPSLAKLWLKFNGGFAKLGLTSLVKYAKGSCLKSEPNYSCFWINLLFHTLSRGIIGCVWLHICRDHFMYVCAQPMRVNVTL